MSAIRQNFIRQVQEKAYKGWKIYIKKTYLIVILKGSANITSTRNGYFEIDIISLHV